MTNQKDYAIDVSEDELVAFANTLDVVLNPREREMDGQSIEQFGLLVSLLKKLTRQVLGGSSLSRSSPAVAERRVSRGSAPDANGKRKV